MSRRGAWLWTAALAAASVIVLGGCELTQRISEGAYRNAVSDGTSAELAGRGIPAAGSPDCVTPETGTDAVVRIRCTGLTTTGARVEVDGRAARADTDRPSESYVIKVDGREVLRRNCLGDGCRRTPVPSSGRRSPPPDADRART